MYTSEQLDVLLQEALAGLGINNNSSDNTYNNNVSSNRYSSNSNKKSKGLSLTPAQALVLAGILGGSLTVFSVLVDADQNINIVLNGSLKRKGNSNDDQLDKMMAKLGRVPFDDIVAAMVRRLK